MEVEATDSRLNIEWEGSVAVLEGFRSRERGEGLLHMEFHVCHCLDMESIGSNKGRRRRGEKGGLQMRKSSGLPAPF